jgi:hypothetical protein
VVVYVYMLKYIQQSEFPFMFSLMSVHSIYSRILFNLVTNTLEIMIVLQLMKIVPTLEVLP